MGQGQNTKVLLVGSRSNKEPVGLELSKRKNVGKELGHKSHRGILGHGKHFVEKINKNSKL